MKVVAVEPAVGPVDGPAAARDVLGNADADVVAPAGGPAGGPAAAAVDEPAAAVDDEPAAVAAVDAPPAAAAADGPAAAIAATTGHWDGHLAGRACPKASIHTRTGTALTWCARR